MGPCAAHAPKGPDSFRFDIQNFRNVTASGVNAPPYEVHAPLREILDAPLFLLGLNSLIAVSMVQRWEKHFGCVRSRISKSSLAPILLFQKSIVCLSDKITHS